MHVIRVSAGEGLLRHFSPLFQEGITVEAETGGSVKAFLCDEVGLDPRYVEEHISTVFLDGMPVDDMDKAVLHDGAVLALSAAMPGLVGATFRKGGYYASMRSDISYRSNAAPGGTGTRRGRVRIKLFNVVMEEAGPQFLRKGIVVDASHAAWILGELSRDKSGGIGSYGSERIPLDGYGITEGGKELLLIVEIRESAE